ncbi:MAG: hypothetical protein ACRCS9_09595 [Hyphomicrobium sp.]
MLTTSLNGPYKLTFDDITASVRRTSPGTFALGYVDTQGNFRIRSVGRSDENIREKLCTMIGSDQCFKYTYANSPTAAFTRECELFHQFKPYGNMLHPERPRGSNLECPRCRSGLHYL